MIEERSKQRGEQPLSLSDFVMRNDVQLYDPKDGLANILDRAGVRLVNQASLLKLHQTLRNIQLSNEQRVRPDWDTYFMELASLAAQRSNCMKRRVGCVLVRDKRVISTGYNGTPRNLRNCNEGGCEFGEVCQTTADGRKVKGVILDLRRAPGCPLACVFTRKKMHCLKPAGNASEKAQFFTVTRKQISSLEKISE